MNDAMFQEMGWFFALMLLGPYIVAPPIAAVWLATAYAVRGLTGWDGLFPPDGFSAKGEQ